MENEILQQNNQNPDITLINNNQEECIIPKTNNENNANDYNSNIFLNNIKNIQILIKKEASNKKICKYYHLYIT